MSAAETTEFLSIRLPDKLVSDLRQIATSEKNSVSAVVRRLLSAGAYAELRSLSDQGRLVMVSPRRGPESAVIHDPQAVRAAMDAGGVALLPRERQIVIRMYGLDGAPSASAAELGNLLGVSATRVRQQLAKAHRKIARWSVKATRTKGPPKERL